MILSKPLLHCRLDWRPSFLLQIILFVLILLAILSMVISALPWYFTVPLCLLLVYASTLKIKKLRQMPRCSLVWRAGHNAIAVNFGSLSESLIEPRCHQQGPLWIICALDADNKKRDFIFLPDTLDKKQRRLLRLVAATPITLD